MGDSFQSRSEHTARKPHRCEYCRQTIPAGERYAKMAGKWEGDFYAGKGHLDCRGLWLELYNDWSWDEGMPWDIAEVFTESGEMLEAQSALDAKRGFFPHAVNRIEFQLRDWLDWGDEE
jgi:hypothetical protein